MNEYHPHAYNDEDFFLLALQAGDSGHVNLESHINTFISLYT